tara:strand:- start:2966 stop:3097 length:132 start_codon:yes stop_codon:yes gene_type:complete
MKLTTFGNVRVSAVLVESVAPSPIILLTVEAVADAFTVKSVVV